MYDHLNPRDKIALMLTRAGSMRTLATELGVSHQHISRWLAGKSLSNFDPASRYFNWAFVTNVESGFRLHAKLCKAIATRQRIPFDPAYPAFWHRRYLKLPGPDGKLRLGTRMFLAHAGHIDREIRFAMVDRMRREGIFLDLQYESTVDLIAYMDQADERADAERKRQRRQTRTVEQWQAREQIERQIDNIREPFKRGYIYTKKVEITERSSPDDVQRAEDMLRSKHEPAAVGPGTGVATTWILQIRQKIMDALDGIKIPSLGATKRPSANSRRHIRGRGNK